MSKIGEKTILIPDGVKVEMINNVVKVTGVKGVLERDTKGHINVEIKDNKLNVKPSVDSRQGSAYWGLYRSLILNMIIGVTKGFEKDLELQGVGYRAVGSGRKITLNLGFSHQVDFEAPEGITIEVTDQTKIKIKGIDKIFVGQVAANIRNLRKPEPYKGKGVRYVGEIVKIKAGKTVVA